MVAHGAGDELCRAFGEAVRQLRLRKDLSQEDLGFRSDLDRTYISGIERGVRNPTLRSMATIAEALETRPSSLLLAAEKRTSKAS